MIYGLNSSSFVPQSDFNAQQSEEGRWEAKQSFLVTRDFLDTFQGQQKMLAGTRATTLDPDLPAFYSFLISQNFSIVHEEAGWAKIEMRFVGFWSANYDGEGADLPTTYAISGTIEDVSILEHPKVVALADIERTLLGALVEGICEWDSAESKIFTRLEDGGKQLWASSAQLITTEDGKLAADEIAKGNLTYKKPLYTWEKREESTSRLSASDLNNLGRIDTPEGNPPEANGGRDWMLVSASSEQRGTTNAVYSNALTWVLSERGGWNAFLYEA